MKHCLEYPFNQGHFEQGRFIPDCKMCGKCCESVWLSADREDSDFILLKAGAELRGHVIYIYSPCRMLTSDRKCRIHEEERPECCQRFGFGNYFHPPGCVFFGGEIDEKLSLQSDE